MSRAAAPFGRLVCSGRALPLLLLGLALLAWFGTLGWRDLITPDEGRYSELSRAMLASGDWISPRLNGFLYFEKPPLQYWATALAFALFGLNDFAARLWPALAAALAVLALWWAARRVIGEKAALYAACVLGSSAWWIGNSHFVNLDASLSAALGVALVAVWYGLREAATPGETRAAMLAAWLAMALAMLSKGLVGIVLPGMVLVVYTLTTWNWGLWKRLHLFSGLVVFFLIVSPWFILVSIKNPEFAHFFFIHEHWDRFTKDGHNRKGHPLYFIPLILVGFIPWLLQLAQGFMTAWKERRGESQVSAVPGFRPLWLAAVWAVMIFLFFSKSQSKLPGYIMPIFPAISLLAGLAMTNAFERMSSAGEDRSWKRQMIYMTLLILAGFIALPYTYQLGKAPYEQLEYQEYTVWIAVALIAALTTMVYAWTAIRGFEHKDPAHRLRQLMDGLLRAAIAFYILVQIVGLGHDTHGRSISGADLAVAVRPYIKDDTPVYSIRMLDHTFPFYIQHPTIMVDMQDELEFGIHQEPDTWAPKVSDFAIRWQKDTAPVVVVPLQYLDEIAALHLPMAEVGRDTRRAVFVKPTHQPAPPAQPYTPPVN